MQRPLLGRQLGALSGGVIDTLTAGYASLNRQLWVLLVPVVLDLFLMLGPQISLSPVVDPTIVRATAWVTRAVLATPAPAQRDAQAVAELQLLQQRLTAATPDINSLSLLTHGLLPIPSLSGDLVASGPLLFVRGWSDALGVTLLGFLGSLGLGGYFYSALAQQVSSGRSDPLTPWRTAPINALRTVAYALLLLAFSAVLGIPLLMLLVFTATLAPVVAMVGLGLTLFAALLVMLHLYFGLVAIFVSGAGPFRAVQGSVSIARRHLRATISFVLLSLLIAAGMGQLWIYAAANLGAPYGFMAAIVGNAYIASGLLAASMLFYREHVDASVFTTS